jgi:ThiF family protein
MREDQIRRYARHVLLPDVGGVGQKRLLDAEVVVSDAGAAGSVAIAYLAAAGVGTIVVADDRAVGAEDVGILYERADVGRPRGDAVRTRVAALNPDVRVSDPHAMSPPTPATAEGAKSEAAKSEAAKSEAVKSRVAKSEAAKSHAAKSERAVDDPLLAGATHAALLIRRLARGAP